MNVKDCAVELFNQHIALATQDGRLFRKTVMDELKEKTGCSQATAATNYNYAKKMAAPIAGLGRSPASKTLQKAGGSTKQVIEIQDDNDCFSVLELFKNGSTEVVGRCQSFLIQGDASESFDKKIEAWPKSTWVLIQGLGPNHNEQYRLDAGEREVKRYPDIGIL